MSKRKNKHVKLLRDPESSLSLSSLQHNWHELDPITLRDLRYGLACAALQGYLSMHAYPDFPMPVPSETAAIVVDYADATLLELINRKYH